MATVDKNYQIITEQFVKEALKNDKGNDAKLSSWEIKDITDIGNHYTSIVTSVLVRYKENNIFCETSYVVKLNTPQPLHVLAEFLKDIFTREIIEVSVDFDSVSFKKLDALLTSRVEGAIEILKRIPNYEKCVKWLQTNIHSVTRYFLKGLLTPSNDFNVIAHGDFTIINMLFRYNENEVPVDVRLLDLQLSRVSSPANDISYFLFTSLEDVRSTNLESMLSLYYKSFSEVLHLKGKKVPFTFENMIEKMFKMQFLRAKNLEHFVESSIFGIISALLVLPSMAIKIYEPTSSMKMEQRLIKFKNQMETCLEGEGPIKERIFALFDILMDINFINDDEKLESLKLKY
ncbi:hypothetical protein Avbf_15000 [Armadillidium vulgare]|nr:hypothetical protein Avbf_15000 [Armadillidium vulgare]